MTQEQKNFLFRRVLQKMLERAPPGLLQSGHSIVKNLLWLMATVKPAISLTGFNVVNQMSKEEFRNEKLYQTTMHLLRKLLEEGVISESEYCQMDTIFLEKYHPVFGVIFSENA